MPWETARKDPAYGTAAWKRARLECLRRARWRCELRLEGCTGAAAEADHEYGLENDPQHRHLKAACRTCHRKKTAQQGNAAKAARNGGGKAPADPPPTSRIIWE